MISAAETGVARYSLRGVPGWPERPATDVNEQINMEGNMTRIKRNPTAALMAEILVALCVTFGPIAFAAADVAGAAADRSEARASIVSECTDKAAV
jgi:hypothetical protein